MKESVLKNILVNIRALFTTNIRRGINQNTNRLNDLENRVDERFYFLAVLDYYNQHESEAKKYIKELNFLRQNWNFCNFPYDKDSQCYEIASGFDEVSRMPYVVHKGKKLFFPSNYSVDAAAQTYLNYVQVEKLLGVEDTEGTPHQYQSSAVHVSEGDVVFDIGAAEGLFALDQVENASHVFVVESNPVWMAPLRNTFAPYGDKVTIIQKFISTVDTENTLSLGKLLSDVNYVSAFVKMDIEGYELPAITSAMDFLKEKQGIKIAAASYHRQHDAEELKTLFDNLGYRSEFSNGYMLFHMYDTPLPPYFRKGVIRARK